jgi:hypothetical protein
LAKKSVVKPKRVVTRRQLSHWQRQKRRRWIIFILGISVIVTVLGLVIGGFCYDWYPSEVKPLKQTVVEVNGTKFDMRYYIDALNFYLGENYYYAQYYLDDVLEAIEQYELIRQAAEELGFSVGDDEVKEIINSYEYDDTQAARDVIRAGLLLEKLNEGYFDPGVPINAEHRHVMAMFLESEAQAAEVIGRLEDGENFGEVAAELSLESTTKDSSGDLGWLPEGVLYKYITSTVLEGYIFESQIGVLSQPIYDEEMTKDVGYWLIRVLERDTEAGTVTVQAILLPSEEEAQEVLDRLDAGEDFAEMAEEYSQYGMEGSRADLGSIAEGDMTTAFDSYAFASETELNVVSGIIRDEEIATTGGYWLFKVLGSEIMDISEADRETLVADDMDEWLLSLWEDTEETIISYLDDEMIEFIVEKVAGE